VPKEGLEPSHPKAQEPKSCVSANSTTSAVKSGQSYEDSGERRTAANSGDQAAYGFCATPSRGWVVFAPVIAA
jgi:hypothetical protein